MPAQNGLAQKIKNLINLTGPIGIDIYMQMCLYDQEFGYYRTKKPIGAKGDFITAPEISQMFGEICGIWLYVNWQKIGAPNQFNLIELGAGRGTLMLDMLRSFRALFKGAQSPEIEIAIIETNENLIALQQNALRVESAEWHNNLSIFFAQKEKSNNSLPLIFIANEFFDCLPIKQYVKSDKGWHEKQIGLSKEQDFTIGLGPLIAFELAKSEAGFFEYSPQTKALLGDIFGALKTYGGAALFIDYGYYNEFSGDTLQAIYRHEKINVLEKCGDADLTAHVDFGAIAEIANHTKLMQFAINTQSNFLLSYGIKERAVKLISANPAKRESIEKDLNRLIGLDQMGELFKVFECYELPM